MLSGCSGCRENACGNLPSTSGRVDVPEPWDDCGDTIVAYEGSIGWQCTNADSAGVEWSMDERAWNVGHIGSDGKLILANRSGASVAHVYETSSYDLQPNGPGPNGNHQQPSYQVEVKTRYSLVGAFKYQYRAQEHRCYWGPNQTDGQKQCYNAGNCLGDPNASAREDCKPDGSDETVIITPTRELPAIVIPDITITGAKSAQDPAGADICGPLPIPVISSQAVIVP